MGLVHGPELVRPVHVQPRDVRDRPRRGAVAVPALALNTGGGVGVIVEVPDFDEEVAALEADLPRDGAFVGVVVLFQREGGEVSLGVAVGIDVNGILKITFVLDLCTIPMDDLELNYGEWNYSVCC